MSIYDKFVVTNIKKVLTVYSNAPRTFLMKSREAYAISFCADEGRVVYDSNGKKVISDKNSVVILPKGADYTLQGERVGNFPIINFDGECAHEFDGVYASKIKDVGVYLGLFERLKRLFSLGKSHAQMMALMYEILAKLDEENTGHTSPIAIAKKYFADNLSDSTATVLGAADAAGVSEVYLRRLFTEELGEGPKEYLTELRMNLAKRLLSERKLTVGEIAEQCGYGSLYHFSRAFKTKCGKNPTEYTKGEKLPF